jgi:hypothetical protein
MRNGHGLFQRNSSRFKLQTMRTLLHYYLLTFWCTFCDSYKGKMAHTLWDYSCMKNISKTILHILNRPMSSVLLLVLFHTI